MLIKQISYLSIRLMAIYVFTLGMIQLGKTLNVWLQMRSLNDISNANYSIFLYTLGPFVLLTLSSVIIWFSANKLTKYLVHTNEKTETQVVNMGLKEIQSLLFSTIGLVLLARSIPQLFQIIPEIKIINSNLLSGPALDKAYFFIAQRILEFVIGFYLFLGSRRLVAILNKIRN